jgi:hypothetical protein
MISVCQSRKAVERIYGFMVCMVSYECYAFDVLLLGLDDVRAHFWMNLILRSCDGWMDDCLFLFSVGFQFGIFLKCMSGSFFKDVGIYSSNMELTYL